MSESLDEKNNKVLLISATAIFFVFLFGFIAIFIDENKASNLEEERSAPKSVSYKPELESKLYSISGDFYVEEKRRSDNPYNDCEYSLRTMGDDKRISIRSGTNDCGTLRWFVNSNYSGDIVDPHLQEVDVLTFAQAGHLIVIFPGEEYGNSSRSLDYYMSMLYPTN